MGLFGNKSEEEKASDEKENEGSDSGAGAGKYPEPCSLCNKAPTDKKWGGQYFHKKCFRKLRKGAKGML